MTSGSAIISDEALFGGNATLGPALCEAIRAPGYHPPRLPHVAVQLMELSRRPRVDIDALARVLESDAMFAGKVLAVARSARYACHYEPADLRDAIVRLGLNTLSDIVLEATMSLRVFRVAGYEEPAEALRKHAITTAHVAAKLATDFGLPRGDLFLAGLMHDVGIVAGLILITEGRARRPLPIDEVVPEIVSSHAVLSEALCRGWELPEAVIDLVRTHHTSERQTPQQAALILADWVAYRAGAGLGVEEHQEQALMARDVLGGLEADAALELIAYAKTICNDL